MANETPHSRQAEEAVIGSVLIYPNLFASATIKSQWFFIERLRFIWQAFEALNKKGQPIDILTVSEQLEASGHLEECGGAPYLTALLNVVPTTLNFDGYAHIMYEHFQRRMVMRGAHDLAQAAYDMSLDIEQVLARTDSVIHGITEHASHEGMLSAEQAVDENNKDDGGDRSMETGFRDTDKIMDGGLLPQDLVLIAGRPGQGKTASMISMLSHMGITQRKHIAIFSMEMSTKRILARLASNLSGIDSILIRKKVYANSTQAQAVEEAMDTISRSHVSFDEHVLRTPSAIRLASLRLKETTGLDAIFIDYIQLMYADSGIAKEGRVQEVSQISRSLKSLAIELDAPVIAACQLSRAVEQRSSQIPQLSDLRESGALEQDADVVIFLHEIIGASQKMFGMDFPAYSMQQIVAKHRDGRVGVAPYLYVKPLSRFYAARIVQKKVEQL